MWLEVDVLLRENAINWRELGLDIKHDSCRRMIRLSDVASVQELSDDIQILTFTDVTSIYIVGKYDHIRDHILHLQQSIDDDTDE